MYHNYSDGPEAKVIQQIEKLAKEAATQLLESLPDIVQSCTKDQHDLEYRRAEHNPATPDPRLILEDVKCILDSTLRNARSAELAIRRMMDWGYAASARQHRRIQNVDRVNDRHDVRTEML